LHASTVSSRNMRPSRRAADTATSGPSRRRLSARELEVALLVSDGLQDAVIAQRLGLAVSTTGLTVRRIRQRLCLKDRQELAAWVAARRSSADTSRALRRSEIDEAS